jgi:hypothetical protein
MRRDGELPQLTASVLTNTTRSVVTNVVLGERTVVQAKKALALVAMNKDAITTVLAFAKELQTSLQSQPDRLAAFQQSTEQQEQALKPLWKKLPVLWTGQHLTLAKVYVPVGHTLHEGIQKSVMDLANEVLSRVGKATAFWKYFNTAVMEPIHRLNITSFPTTSRTDTKLPYNGAGLNAMHLKAAQRVFGVLAAETLERWRVDSNGYPRPTEPQIKAFSVGAALAWLYTRGISIERKDYLSWYRQRKTDKGRPLKETGPILVKHARELIRSNIDKPQVQIKAVPLRLLQKHLALR